MTSTMADDPVAFRVKTLTPPHAGLLEALESGSGGGIAHSGATPAELQEVLGAADSCVLGAFAGAAGRSQRLVGFVWLARQPFDAEIQAIGVLPALRGRGVGDALMRAARVAAEHWQSERLLLEVRAGNAAAIGLYQRHGFSVDGRRNNYYPASSVSGAAREDALLMSLALTT